MPGWLPSDPSAAENDLARSTSGPASPNDLEVPALRGIGPGVGMGVMRGGAKFAQGVNLLGGALPVAADVFLGGTENQDAYFARMVKPLDSAIDYWTPDARTVGSVGNVLGGFGEIVLPLMAGGAPGMISTVQTGTALELSKEGVDADTANKVALVSGMSAAVGFHIPFAGTTLTSRVGSGIAGNLAANMGGTSIEGTTLQQSGFPEQAKRFDPWNAEARAIDVLTGAAFGAIAHVTAPRATRAQQDAILTAANANRLQTTSAPARPANAVGQDAHVSAMDSALQAVARGERVNLADAINPADFITHDVNPQLPAVHSTAREAAVLSNLSGPRATIAEAAATAGVNPQTALAIAAIESRFDPTAKNPVSSATGLFQFLDSTWNKMGGTGENRFDVATQARLGAELIRKNTDDLTAALGRDAQPHEVYLAHLLGIGRAKRVLTSDPSTPMVEALAVKNAQTIVDQNGMSGMTVGQAVEKWRRKIDDAGASSEPQVARQATIAPEPVPREGAVPPAPPESATQAEGKAPSGIDSDFQTARETAMANPDLHIQLEDGTLQPAHEAVAQMDADLAEAGNTAKLFDVAINCFLRGGF